jgi:hypothetical protein
MRAGRKMVRVQVLFLDENGFALEDHTSFDKADTFL